MKTFVYEYDIPENLIDKVKTLAIDTEAMGLKTIRDRLCTVQMLINESDIHIVHFPEPKYKSNNLVKLLQNNKIKKIFHFARFDMYIMYKYLGVLVENVVCTRMMSKIARTYSDKHSLKELCRELLKKDLNKGEQSSDWGREKLTESQISYAGNDVIYLPKIYESLKIMCVRENRMEVVEKMFAILPNLVFTEANHFDILELIDH